MKQRRRIYYSAAQRSEIWDRWQSGEPMSSIGRRFDRESSSVFSVISPTGGIRPPVRRRAKGTFSPFEREESSRELSTQCSLRLIARQLGRSASTISREVDRNGGSDRYRATRSDQAGWDRALRPKLCKLACRPFLSRTVSIKLRQQWSPEQIAGWLKRTYPGELQNQVSRETIYRSLFIQARGVLKKELLEHLRAKRTIRRSKHASLKRNGLGQIKNAVSISERPASIEDRAVPGHWEGDLIGGSRNSYVATLVERHSRYVMLVKVANKDTESVVSALIKQSQSLPGELYRSLTWDRGKELADHQHLTRQAAQRLCLFESQLTRLKVHDTKCPQRKTSFGYKRKATIKLEVRFARDARIFNRCGPGMRPDDGRVVSNFVLQALREEDITIYGDGSHTRSMCYVDDLIEGLLRLMALDVAPSGPINLGNPREVSILDFARRVIRATGSRSKIAYLPELADAPCVRCPDISRAKAELHWEPRTTLEDGLTMTIDYFRRALRDNPASHARILLVAAAAR